MSDTQKILNSLPRPIRDTLSQSLSIASRALGEQLREYEDEHTINLKANFDLLNSKLK